MDEDKEYQVWYDSGSDYELVHGGDEKKRFINCEISRCRCYYWRNYWWSSSEDANSFKSPKPQTWYFCLIHACDAIF